QVWGVAGDAGFKETFRIRRTELYFSGSITPKARWMVMIDPSKALSLNNAFTTIPTANGSSTILSGVSVNQASRILQNAFISFDYIPRVRVDVGQLKLPLGLEGGQSSAALDTVERTLFASDRARGGSLGDVRDVGILVSGPITKYVDFYIGEYNSTGDRQNDVAVNDQKATSGRLVFKPHKFFQVGVSGAYGNGGSHADRPRHDRLGVELLIKRRGLTLKSEWMQGKDGNILRQGYYGHIGYKVSGRFEPVFRFDTFDPDVSHTNLTAATVPERDYVAGLNYYITENHWKMQVNYVRKTFGKDLVPTRNLVFLNLQTSW
ncbi:MAG TPA: porin, partial [Candidatus Binatia bacterium]|nr:porin [Candidatus Binatia bacterium]